MTAALSAFYPQPIEHVRAVDPASTVLADVLQTVRVSSVCYGKMELGAPWGVAVEPHEKTSFIAILDGAALLEVDGQPDAIPLGKGDLCVFPHGSGHVLRDALTTEATSLQALIAGCGSDPVRFGGPGPGCTLVGGALELEAASENPVVGILPNLIVSRGEHGRAAPWLEPMLSFMAHELGSERPGGQAVIRLLATVLFVQVARTHLTENLGKESGWLRGLSEPHIASALSLIHQNPEGAWTVATLARRVGMSRSAFADRFTSLVGEPPLHYVTRMRMQQASALLRDGAAVAEAAERAGYGSEAAFSKAFKRWIGQAPGAYRRSTRTAVSV
ncbi:MAG: AraC family transcriptional regulator [Myxococcales bacterium]|nr:AraC family transcriptional regulator [Myxococcales bacterium]MCB9581542.1 AraC family transcriptional regulator [Polyangiaceae bacterium]